MFNYCIKRLIVMLITLFGITVITFVITRLAPGDPATLKVKVGTSGIKGGAQQARRIIAQTRKLYGFDKPLILNFRNENYKTESKKLVKTLLTGDEYDREDARIEIREVSSLALPALFDEINEKASLAKIQEGDKEIFQNEFLDILPTIVHHSLQPDEIKNNSQLSDEEKIQVWKKWWIEKRGYYEGINASQIGSALAESDDTKREELFLRYGGFAVRYLIAEVLKSKGGKEGLSTKALRSAAALELIVKKPWRISHDLSDAEFSANLDRWKRWWRNEQVRFVEFSTFQKINRIFTATQYGQWLGKLLIFDFDISYTYNRPSLELIKERLPISLQLSIISIFISYIIAIPLGIFSSTHRNTKTDQIITVILFILYSLPSFWVASMLIMFTTGGDFPNIFPSRYLHSIGYESFPFWKQLTDWLWHLVLPVACYTYASFAFLSRQMRTSMLEVIKQDFIRTARAKGLPERVVIFKHALRNSLIPILTLSASLLPELLGGSVVIEQIFSIDGLGKLSFEAILNRDYPLVNAILFFSAVLTLIGILLADLSYAIADPRIRFE